LTGEKSGPLLTIAENVESEYLQGSMNASKCEMESNDTNIFLHPFSDFRALFCTTVPMPTYFRIKFEFLPFENLRLQLQEEKDKFVKEKSSLDGQIKKLKTL
jgi:hypothetical protein